MDTVLPLNKHIWWFLSGCIFYKILVSHSSRKLQALLIVSITLNLVAQNFDSSGAETQSFSNRYYGNVLSSFPTLGQST